MSLITWQADMLRYLTSAGRHMSGGSTNNVNVRLCNSIGERVSLRYPKRLISSCLRECSVILLRFAAPHAAAKEPCWAPEYGFSSDRANCPSVTVRRQGGCHAPPPVKTASPKGASANATTASAENVAKSVRKLFYFYKISTNSCLRAFTVVDILLSRDAAK